MAGARNIKLFLIFFAILALFAPVMMTEYASADSESGSGEIYYEIDLQQIKESIGEPQISSMGAIVIDFETGLELFAHNADRLHCPASMTKMMTVYLVYEALESGKIELGSVVPISDYVVSYASNPAWTNVPLNKSGTYYVDELLDTVIVCSAGGSANALAELVSGSRSSFIKKMNDTVKEWGIDAVFNSASGGLENTNLTPRAMAEITRRSIQDYPQVLERTSLESVTFRGRTYPNTNQLLGVYEGTDGFKTGTNELSKENFSGTAQRGDVRIIAVTMGSAYGKRFSDTTALFDYGFAVMEQYNAQKAILEAERLEAERLEAERLEAERLEAERLEAERLEAERLEAERLEAERLEAERLEAERIEAERLEAERLEAERLETQELAASTGRAFIIVAVFIVLIVCTGYFMSRSFRKRAVTARQPK